MKEMPVPNKLGKAALVCGDRKSFIEEHLDQKRFMLKVGPGSYNLGENVQVMPSAVAGGGLKKRRRRSFEQREEN